MTSGMMPRISDMAGGVADAATYRRLATLFAGAGQSMTAKESRRRNTVATLLRDAAGTEQEGETKA